MASGRASGRFGRLLTGAIRMLIGAFFVLALAFIAVRDLALPNADVFRERIAASVSDALGLPVRIGEVRAEWSGLHPTLAFEDVRIADASGRNALGFSRVSATLSWSSVARGHPVFLRLEVRAPELDLRREADGRILVAGIDVASDPGGGGFGEWLLDQPEILIRDATLVWSDAQRAAPPLVLDRLDLRIENRGRRHRFGLQASPPEQIAAAIDLRGDFTGENLADWSTWRGKVFARLERADLAAWQGWLDFPVPLSGGGGANAWFEIEGPRQYTLKVDLALADARTRLRPDLPELVLDRVQGSLTGWRDGPAMSLSTQNLAITGEGVDLRDLDVMFEHRPDPSGDGGIGRIRARHLDLGALAVLASHLPFEPDALQRLSEHAPAGEIDDLDYGWNGGSDGPRAWTVSAVARDLRISAGGGWPGVEGVSGRFYGDRDQGSFELSGEDVVLDLPKVFPDPRLTLASLALQGRWLRQAGEVEVLLDQARFENPDAAGTASGRYRPIEGGPGDIDLEARLTRADGQAVWRYMPLVVDAHTRDWLRAAITGGRSPDARLTLRGDLDRFPFADGRSGQFLVTVRMDRARLAYAPDWPAIEDIDGELRFEGRRMRIVAERGRVGDAEIGRTVAEIADLGNGDQVLTVRGKAAGPTTSFLAFVASSPVSSWIGHFTDGIRASGNGELDLALALPLHRLDDSRVEGEYRFTDNTVRLFDELPELQAASARIGFTTDRMTIADGRARLLGEPVAANGGTDDDGVLRIVGSGTATAEALRRATGQPILDHVRGRTGWTTRIEIHDHRGEVAVDSDLRGFASVLPAPLDKPVDAAMPLQVRFSAQDGGARQRWAADLGDGIRTQLERRRDGAGNWGLVRAGLAVNAPLRMADGGWMAAIEMPALDLDAWRRMFEGGPGTGQGVLAGIALHAGQLTVFGERFDDLALRAVADPGGWHGELRGADVSGEFDWRSRDQGALQAKFERLAIGSASPDSGLSREGIREAAEAAPDSLPALDVTARRFRLRGLELGELELYARNLGGAWRLGKLRLQNEHGVIEGSGRWQPGGQTQLDFTASVADVGAYLAGIGYPDAVRNGKAALKGALGWQGPPTDVDYGSLAGQLHVSADDGQFRKLEPGVGRLLGVLSLQSLPRRITLDFNDVFSEGFAFDRIEGAMTVAGGVMRTDDLAIRGPAARVSLRGSVDLAQESQDLRVGVQPTLTESVAVGAALANSAAGLINPVAGLVTYFAQKIMQDPIEKLFSYQYSVTGAWDDPRVVKLNGVLPDGTAVSRP